MTREEAIKLLKDDRALCINSEAEPFAVAYDMAIKALEQEPMLDKIKRAREEMKERSYSLRCFNENVFDEDERVVDLDNVLIILDKLIESEE